MLEEFQEIDGFGASTSGRALLQDDSSERIAGVGSGLFALTFISAIALVMIFVGIKSSRTTTLVLPAIGMVGITVLILFTAPRGPSKSELGTSTQIIAAGSLVAIMGLAAVLGIVLLALTECCTRVDAQPLNYRKDVLAPL